MSYDYNCWVCFELFTDPITLYCSHSFCKTCLEKSYQLEQICPFCRKEIQTPFPSIDQELNKRILKLKGIEVDENNNNNNNSNNNNNNSNNNNNNNYNDVIMEPIEDDKPIQIKKITFGILNLPSLIYVQIFNSFTVQQLAQLSLVCKEFNKITNHSWVWKSKLFQFTQFCNTEKYNFDYKKCFRISYQSEKNENKGASGTFKMTPFRGHTQAITCVDHVGNLMSTGSTDNTVRVWDLTSKKGVNIHTFKGHTNAITCIKQRQFTATSGSADSTVRIWDLEKGEETSCFNHNHYSTNAINSFDYNPNIEGQLVSATLGEVLLWDYRNNLKAADIMTGVVGEVRKVEFHSNGHLFVHSSDYLDSWDMRRQDKPILRLPSPNGWFKPTTDFVYTLSANNSIIKYNIQNGKLITNYSLTTAGHSPLVTARSVFAATNDTVAFSVGNNAYLLDSNLKLSHTLVNHTNTINTILIDDKKVLTGSVDNTIKVWDKSKGQRLYSLLGGSNIINPADPIPLVAGCSKINYDRSRIIGVFNNLVRLYNFNLD